jgi:hypothetical protein
MSDIYTLQWEQVVANRVVRKEKYFTSVDKLNQFRKQIMQQKRFFKLLTVKGDIKGGRK